MPTNSVDADKDTLAKAAAQHIEATSAAVAAAMADYQYSAQRRADNMNRLFAQIDAWNRSGRRKYLRRYYVRGRVMARRRRGKRG